MNISNSDSRLKQIQKLVSSILAETEMDCEGLSAIRAIGDAIGCGFCNAAINGNTETYAKYLKENFEMASVGN